MRTLRAAATAILLACIAALGVAGPAQATPLLAMQSVERCDTCHVQPNASDPKWQEANTPFAKRECRATCGACHVNPSGGMLRTEGGMHFGTKALPFARAAEAEQTVSSLKGNPLLTVGGDMRFLDIITDQEGKESPFFFPMQGDLYAASRLHKNVAVLTQFGLQRGGNPVVREAFGLVDHLPLNSYLKFGKFMPPYGHKLDDHTAYIRKELMVDQSNPVSYDSGVEIGLEPLVFFGRAAYFNRDLTPKQNTDATPTVWAGTLGWQGLWLELGGSFLRVNDNDAWGDTYDSAVARTGDRTAYGGFGAVRLGPLAWLFEADWRRDEIDGMDERNAFITFNELNWHAMRGLTVKARYETFDPDTDADDDAVARYVAGVDFHPWPFVEVNFQYRLNDMPEKSPGTYPTDDYNQYLFMIHLWF